MGSLCRLLSLVTTPSYNYSLPSHYTGVTLLATSSWPVPLQLYSFNARVHTRKHPIIVEVLPEIVGFFRPKLL